MGLFAKIRKNSAAIEDSDDWLLGLADDGEEPGLPTNEPIPEPRSAIVGEFDASQAAMAMTPEPGPVKAGWHLPDLDVEPTVALDDEPIDFDSTGSGPTTFDDPKLPSGDTGWGHATLDHPGFDDPSFEAPAFDDPGFEAPSFEPIGFDLPTFDATSFDAAALADPAWPAAGWDDDGWTEQAGGLPEFPIPGGPSGPGTETLLEILGLFPGCSWHEVSAAHRELIAGHQIDHLAQPGQIELAEEIRREMNSAYATLRLMAVGQ